MKRTIKYVGLDVHQATTVTTVREETGQVIARMILPTEAAPIVDWFRGLRGSVHVAFEEGTQAQWLHELLVPVVDRVLVCNRRGPSTHGNKGDQPDADELSELLRCGRLRAVYHGGRDRATLKELARTYQNLVEDSTRVMLRLKALFRARGIKTAGTAAIKLLGARPGSVNYRPRVCGSGPRRCTPSSRSCRRCGPRRRRRCSPKRNEIRRGPCCAAFRISGPCALRCC